MGVFLNFSMYGKKQIRDSVEGTGMSATTSNMMFVESQLETDMKRGLWIGRKTGERTGDLI